MKKKLVVLLGLAMLVGTLTACGAKEQETPVSEETIEVVETETADAAESETEADNGQDVMEYLDGDIAVYHRTDAFTSSVDEEKNEVTLTFEKAGVNAEGTNYITFRNEKGADYKELMDKLAAENGINSDEVFEVALPCSDKALGYIVVNQESDLTFVETVYTVPYDGGAAFINSYRTVGQDEGTEMSIDSEFEFVMQSFKFMH